MATPNRKKVVITNSTCGNVVFGAGKIKNLKMYSSISARPQRQVNKDYCGDTDGDLVISGTVAGNVVVDSTDIDNIEMISEECGTGFGDQYGRSDADNTDTRGVYKISCGQGQRGCVLIIDNLDNEARGNSNADKMQKMWQHLGYSTYISKNLTAEELKTKVMRFSKKPGLKHVDCVVIMILCNGDGKNVYASDGVPVLVDELTKNFNVDKCINMAGKPKLMFFEYCTEDDVEVDSPQKQQNQNIKGTKSDTYIAHKMSHKSEIEGGSKFIEAIDKAFREGAKTKDLNDLMRKVGCHIRTEDSLNRDLYLQQDQM